MKKLLLVIALLALPFTAQADGSYPSYPGQNFDSSLLDNYDRGYGGINRRRNHHWATQSSGIRRGKERTTGDNKTGYKQA